MAVQRTDTAGFNFDKKAWELLAHFALRPQLFYDGWATVKAGETSHPSRKIGFTFMTDIAPLGGGTRNYGLLSEDGDATEQTFGDSSIEVEIKEYGAVIKTTKFLRLTGFIPVNPVVANLIGWQAGEEMDALASSVLHGGDKVRLAGGAAARTDLNRTESADYLKAAEIRRAVAYLRGKNVVPLDGGAYAASIHPDVSVDLRTETGAAAWRDPHVYSAPEHIWNGEIGMFEGVRFIETPRAGVVKDAGDAATFSDVYQTLVVGREAVAKAHLTGEGMGAQPIVVASPVTDNLARRVGMGWYHAVGYKVFRQDALYRIESASSLDPGTDD